MNTNCTNPFHLEFIDNIYNAFFERGLIKEGNNFKLFGRQLIAS